MTLVLGILTAGLVLAALLVSTRPAAASCAPPASVEENAERAVAVVYGRVTERTDHTITVEVERVLKGSADGTIVVLLGPGRDGAFTSVDYSGSERMGEAPAIGSDHVLYLVEGQDGALETNACGGSHPGPPAADEEAYFGSGEPSDATAEPSTVGGAGQSTGTGGAASQAALMLAALAVLGLALLAMLLSARRRPSIRES